MKEADKFKDLLKIKNYWRYLKKFFVLGLSLSIAWRICTFVLGFFGIDKNLTASAQAGGFVVSIVIFVALAVQMVFGGFLMEYISNSSTKLMKWIRK